MILHLSKFASNRDSAMVKNTCKDKLALSQSSVLNENFQLTVFYFGLTIKLNQKV